MTALLARAPFFRRALPRLLSSLLMWTFGTAALAAGSGEALQARLNELRPALARSPFGRPVVLRSVASDESPRGEVYALVRHPFGQVAAAMQKPESWCALMLLQTNVKRCQVRGSGSAATLDVGIARRYTDPVDAAQAVTLKFQAPAASADHAAARLSAPEGPLGTRDYSLRFEAVPAGPDTSFVHFAYAYDTGSAARLATQMYLATSGRDKVGFTVVGQDEQGRPRRVGGLQGVAERNTMRYFLAIEALLDTQDGPPAQRLEQRLRGFHAALERYPAQLHETELGEYLAMKRRELAGAGA